MAKKKVSDIAAEILEPFLEAEGYELYHSEFVKEGGNWFLRIYIDRIGADAGEGAGDAAIRPDDGTGGSGESSKSGAYISTEDCEKVSRFLSEKLDEADPVQQNYYLEVSSPGMDRPLITRRHYELALGKVIDVRLYRGKDGRKNYTGLLKAVDDEGIVIEEEDGKEIRLDMTEIARARQAVII